MATITNPPRGLISIFGLNDFGKVPNQLTESLVGVFDVAELCLLNRELLSGSVSTGPGVGAIVLSTVPSGELWYVWTFAIRTQTIPAGESVQFNPGYIQQGQFIASGQARAAQAGQQVAAATPGKFFLGPGTGLGVLVEAEAGAAKTLFFDAVIVRLRV